MPGYTTRSLDITLGGHAYRIRALADLQQFSDPDQAAERAGISSALWPFFGQVWPAGRVLAEVVSGLDIVGKRILELGCGLALSSLVLQRRGADITASDHHPLAPEFLEHNARLNALPLVRYHDLHWEVPDPALGRFDLIIGSDILYEQGHAALLSDFVARHAYPHAEVLITDPGRGNGSALSRALAAQGFVATQTRMRMEDTEHPPYRGRLWTFRR